MGAPWEFDANFKSYDQWCDIRRFEGDIFYWLMLQPDFYNAYVEMYHKISPGLFEDICHRVDEFLLREKEALQESLYLDAARWNYEAFDIEQEKQETEIFLFNRINWMNSQLQNN